MVQVDNELQMTPREGASSQPKPALKKPASETARRNSRVSFVKDFGLNLRDESEDEVDMGLQSDAEESPKNATAGSCSTFALADTDSDSSDSDDELDDEYDFDHEKLAELVKAGANRGQLASVVEEAMAAALERKLCQKKEEELKDVVTLATAKENNDMTEDGDCWELEGRMTPGQMTPVQQMTPGQMTPPEGNAAATVECADDLAAKCQAAMASANARRRRSSALKKNEAVSAGIANAMEEAKERRRKSLAKLNGGSDVQENIAAAMQNASRRHRQSISKAADVLGDAGFDEDGADCSEAAAKMRLVQQAMEDARRRHRRSIAEAVRALEEPAVTSKFSADATTFTPLLSAPVTSKFSADANTFTPLLSAEVSATPQVAATGFGGQEWAQGDSSNWCSQDNTWGGQSADNWGVPTASFQQRIGQAVSSAYQNYTEQSYVDQYTDQGCNGYSQVSYDQQGCGQGGYGQQMATNTNQQCYGQQGCGQQMVVNNNEQGYGQQCYSQQYPQNYQQETTYVQQSAGQQPGGQDSYQMSYQQQQQQPGPYGQQMAANTNQQWPSCGQQPVANSNQQCYVQQDCGQQMVTNTNQPCYGQQVQQVCQQEATYVQQPCGQQFGGQYVQDQNDQSWQYGGAASYGMQTKDNSCWNNQTTYNAAWGSA